jgi:hypothetical protein
VSDLRELLQGIYNDRGRLTPALVVEEARPDDSPLHDRFEWDNEVAGEEYRRHQARQLIRSVKVVYSTTDDGDDKKVRAFTAIHHETGHVYEPTERVAQDPFLTKVALQDMKRRWIALKRQYESFDEFWQLVQEDQRAIEP